MSQVLFTKSLIAKLRPPEEGRRELCDKRCRGLRLRLSSTAHAVFSAALRIDGKLKRYDLGPAAPELLDQARDRTYALKQAARDGRPVLAAVAPVEITFDEMRVEYLSWCEKRRVKSLKQIRGDLHNKHLDRFAKRKAATLTTAQIQAVLDEIGLNTGLHSAKNVLKRLRPMMKRAVGRGDIPANPCANIPAPVADNERDRVWVNAETKAIYKASYQLPDPLGQMFRFAIHTGQRLTEVRLLKRSEIVDDVWSLTGIRTKNGRRHSVPLTQAALAQLRSLPDHGIEEYAFSIKEGKVPRTFGKRELARIQKLSGTSNWGYHDIRRTVRTKLAELGVPDEVAERVINHTPGKLLRTYNLHAYAKEKREALEKWDEHLAELIGAKRQLTPLELFEEGMRRQAGAPPAAYPLTTDGQRAWAPA